MFALSRLRDRHRPLPLVVGIALMALAQTSAYAHLGLVAHDVCDDHGEITEHARGGADTDTDASDHSDDHDHCVLTLWNDLVTPELSPSPVDVHHASELVAHKARDTERDHRGPHILRVAPKTSPPSSTI